MIRSLRGPGAAIKGLAAIAAGLALAGYCGLCLLGRLAWFAGGPDPVFPAGFWFAVGLGMMCEGWRTLCRAAGGARR